MAKLIDVEEAISELKKLIDCSENSFTQLWPDGRIVTALKFFIGWLERRAVVDAALVIHSRWVKDSDGDEYCENCLRYMPIREVTGDPSATNYCPNCGAVMDLEEG